VQPPENFHFGQALPDGNHFLSSATQNGNAPGEIRLGSLEGGPLKSIMKADNVPMYVEPGYLLYLKGETLLAHAFDIARGALKGAPQVLAERIGRSAAGFFFGNFSASKNGVLIYRHGSRYKESTLTWFDRDGRAMGTVGEPAELSNPALSRRKPRCRLHPRSADRQPRHLDLRSGSRR
jgi:hypothetical protein